MRTFEDLLANKNTVSKKELELFFDQLEPITPQELSGIWRGGFFPTGSLMEFFISDFIIFKWYGKKFISKDNAKALLFSFFGIKLSIPIGNSFLKEINFKGKNSTSIIYKHLPIIDYLRKVNKNTLMGIMEMNGKIKIYFYLQKNE
ncbi:DUF4334 domain-containing protein [Patescibacteria group bacterium]